jgi:hypothetical protein
MLLFIDRLPLYSWLPARPATAVPLLSVSLPVIVTDLGAPPHPRARPQRWAVDTRFTGEAYAWRQHLLEAGLNPDTERNGYASLTPLGGAPQSFPLRKAGLWLVSNLPAWRGRPYRLELVSGIAFRDQRALPNPESNCPLLGMRALASAGLKVTIDFANRSVSVWVPGSWHQKATLLVRRMASGLATEPIGWE